MKVFKTNAEPRLLEIVEVIKSNAKTWRAQLFRLSLLKTAGIDQNFDNILLGFVIDRLAEHEGFAFVCSDGDVLLVGHSIFKKSFDQISQDFEKHIPSSFVHNLSSPLIQLFDLGVAWNSFIGLCDEKSQIFHAKRKAQSSLIKPAAPLIPPSQAVIPVEAYQRLFAKGLAERKDRKKPCILLVEDDLLSLHMARKALEKNFTILTAPNATEARRAYLEHAPDVVFLDIGLPDVNGHALLSEFVAIDSEAYVVMLSGNSFQNDILKSMQNGAKGFVGKPFSRAKLLHYIAQSPHCGQSVSLMNLQ